VAFSQAPPTYRHLRATGVHGAILANTEDQYLRTTVDPRTHRPEREFYRRDSAPYSTEVQFPRARPGIEAQARVEFFPLTACEYDDDVEHLDVVLFHFEHEGTERVFECPDIYRGVVALEVHGALAEHESSGWNPIIRRDARCREQAAQHDAHPNYEKKTSSLHRMASFFMENCIERSVKGKERRVKTAG
jgi:hypothetical protein